MVTEDSFQAAATRLKIIWKKVQSSPEMDSYHIAAAKDEVLTRYQPVFAPGNLDNLSEEEYKSFLLFKNNQHWTGLHRVGGKATEDMSRLRAGLKLLLNETLPVSQRLDSLHPKNKPPFVPYLGRAVITAILHIAYPDRYGVWNNTSESGLKDLGIWPQFDRGASLGERYLQINNTLLRLSQAIGVDLWTLDALFWNTGLGEDVVTPETFGEPLLTYEPVAERTVLNQQFGLERHLHLFIYDNWDRIEHFLEWSLHEEGGDIVGYEYNTGEIGRIDLLAHHKRQNRWLVIELKRAQSSDETIGQTLRYMGWVSENLAQENDTVEGLIISHQSDVRLRYALKHVPTVRCMLYEVSFRLVSES